MKNPQGAAGVAIVLLALAVGLGWVYANSRSVTSDDLPLDYGMKPPPGAPTPSPAVKPKQPVLSNPNNALFSSTQYGFSFEYPKTNPVETADYGSLHPFQIDPIAYINVWDNKQTEGYMTVSVSNDPQDTSNCMETVREVPEVSINGVNFHQIDYGEGGVNGFGREYKTLRNNYCYNINIITFAGACVNSGCDNRLWSDQTEKDLLNKLDVYAKTFKFTTL